MTQVSELPHKLTSWCKLAAPRTQQRRKPNTLSSTARSSTPSSSSKTSAAPTIFGHWLQDRSTNAQAKRTHAHIPWFSQESCCVISWWNSGIKLWSDNNGKVSSGKNTELTFVQGIIICHNFERYLDVLINFTEILINRCISLLWHSASMKYCTWKKVFLPLKEDCISAASSRGSTFKQYNMVINSVRVTLSNVPSASVDGHFLRKDSSWRQSLLGSGDWQAKQNRHSAKSCLWSVMKSMSCCLWRSSPIACPLSSLSSSFWTSSWSNCWRIVVVNPETTKVRWSINVPLQVIYRYDKHIIEWIHHTLHSFPFPMHKSTVIYSQF